MNISSTSLRTLIPLVEKREKLAQELAAIERQISASLDGQSPVGSGRKAAPPKARTIQKGKRVKRGALKETILAALKEAGEAGIAVKHLAAKIGIKPQNIHVWLHTTGKKAGLIKAVSKGIYRLEEAVGVATPKSALTAPKPKVVKKTAKPRKKQKSKAAK